MFENRYFFRFRKDLITGDPAPFRFRHQMVENAVRQTFSLVLRINGDIAQNTAAQRAGRDQAVTVKDPHGIVNIPRKSQFKAGQKIYQALVHGSVL